MSDEWRTPPDLFAMLDAEFHFGLDAAASPENALVSRYLTQADDALVTRWSAPSETAIWCNPPYSRLPAFIRRAWEESCRTRLTTVLLIPAYTDPRYWTEYVMGAHEVRFLKGRLSFLDETNQRRTSARYPSVVVVNRWIAGRHYGKAPHQWVWDWRA